MLGGVEALPLPQQAEVRAVHDEQLLRAKDLLKGLMVYDTLTPSAPKPEKTAAK
jgi:hypothetical protein